MSLRHPFFSFLISLLWPCLIFSQNETLTIGASTGVDYTVKGKFTPSGKNFIVYPLFSGPSNIYNTNQKRQVQTIQNEHDLQFLEANDDFIYYKRNDLMPGGNGSAAEHFFQMKSFKTGRTVLEMRTEVLALAPNQIEMAVKGNPFDQEFEELERLKRAGNLAGNSLAAGRYSELRNKQNSLLTIVELPGGKERKLIDTKFEIQSAEYHPGGKHLYVLGMAYPNARYWLKKYETVHWQLLEQYEIKEPDFSVSAPMVLSPDGSKLAIRGTGSKEDDHFQGQILVFEMGNWGQPILRIKIDPSLFFYLRFHANTNYLGVYSAKREKCEIRVFDTRNGKLHHSALSASFSFLYDFHPTQDWLVTSTYDNWGGSELKIVDLQSFEKIKSWKLNSLEMQSIPVFDPSGKYLVYIDQKGMKYLELENTESKSEELTKTTTQKGLTYVRNIFPQPGAKGKGFILQVPDAKQGKLITLDNVVQLAEAYRGSSFYLEKKWPYKMITQVSNDYQMRIGLKDVATDKLLWETTSKSVSDIKISPSGKYLVVLRTSQKRSSYYFFYEVRDIKTGKLVKELPANYATINIQFGSNSEDFLLLNIPKKCNRFSFKNLPVDYFDLDIKRTEPGPAPVYPALIRIPDGEMICCWDFDLQDGYPLVTQPLSIKNGKKIVTVVQNLGFVTNDLKIMDSQGAGNSLQSISISEVCGNGRVERFFDLNNDDSFLLCCLPDHRPQELVFTKVNIQTGELNEYANLKGFVAGFNFAQISPDGKYFFMVNTEGCVEVWHLPKNEKLLTIYTTADGGYVLLTPDGYYFGAKGALENVRFSAKDQSLPFQQYDLKYNRPDIILSRFEESPTELVELYRKAYEKRMEKMGFDENLVMDENQFPEIKVTNGTIPPFTNEEFFEVFVEASDSKYLLDRLNIWVNDVPIFGSKGQSVRNRQSRQFQSSYKIPLTPGENRFRLSVMNVQGVESLLENFTIEYRTLPVEPDLYLITVGTSDYQAAGKDLQYAGKDARDIAALYENASGFQKVHTKVLTDAQVTKSNILALRAWLEQSRVDDQVLIYVSGHGLLDDNYDFYYATHDIDFANPSEKGILYDDIEGLLDGIPARKKLLLMDACHSGEYDKEAPPLTAAQQDSLSRKGISFKGFSKGEGESAPVLGLQNSFELMQQLFADLRRGSGATVISSSAGVQVSYEDAEWQNGAFTYAFLYGLRSMKADANQDGQVTASEIQAFVGEFVPRLTEGLQVPTFRRENLEFDFRVW